MQNKANCPKRGTEAVSRLRISDCGLRIGCRGTVAGPAGLPQGQLNKQTQFPAGYPRIIRMAIVRNEPNLGRSGGRDDPSFQDSIIPPFQFRPCRVGRGRGRSVGGTAVADDFFYHTGHDVVRQFLQGRLGGVGLEDAAVGEGADLADQLVGEAGERPSGTPEPARDRAAATRSANSGRLLYQLSSNSSSAASAGRGRAKCVLDADGIVGFQPLVDESHAGLAIGGESLLVHRGEAPPLAPPPATVPPCAKAGRGGGPPSDRTTARNTPSEPVVQDS